MTNHSSLVGEHRRVRGRSLWKGDDGQFYAQAGGTGG